MNDEHYVNIREILSDFIGQRLVDITQHDEEEYAQTKQAYVVFMFENGSTIKMPVEEGFTYEDGKD